MIRSTDAVDGAVDVAVHPWQMSVATTPCGGGGRPNAMSRRSTR